MTGDLPRRRLLAGAASGFTLLSGCSSLPFFGGGCASGYSLDVTPLTDAELAATVTHQPRPKDAAVAKRLIETAAKNGDATYTTYHDAPLQPNIYVEHEGAYYRVERTVTTTQTLTAHTFAIEYNETKTPPGTATVIEFTDLPEADRAAFQSVYPDEKHKKIDEAHSFSIGGYPYVYPDDAESLLIDAGTVWIRYEGRPYAVTVEGTQPVEKETFQYTLETIAADREAFVAFVRDRFVVAFDNLSTDEQAVFERAIDESLSKCEPLSDGFRGLVDRLHAVPDDRRLSPNEWLVNYDGSTYEVVLERFVA